jgi:2-oxoglutarate ferredoxin oxidoreductase subunit beta
MLVRANSHKGASFLEIYQNCNIFNDGAFEVYTEKKFKGCRNDFPGTGETALVWANNDKGIRLDGFTPKWRIFLTVTAADDCWIHDRT